MNKETVEYRIDDGYARLSATWRQGDKIELDLPMPVRQLIAHHEVVENTGKIALQRGPLVYCVEGVDQKKGTALNLVFDKNATFDTEFRASLLNGISVIFGSALSSRYDESGTIRTKNQDFTAIPYFAWAHRGNAEMMVWLPTEVTAAKPLNGPSIASTSLSSSSGGKGLKALNDLRYPDRSNETTVPAFVWEPDSESVWVEYRFRQPEEISETQVFWYDDNNHFSVPESWRVRVLFDGEWRSVWNNRREWGTEKDRFNKMLFETVKTTAARLEVVLQPGFSAGIFEWRIY